MTSETTTTTTSVLIAGAGPTGLMLACMLARRGVSFRVIDSSPGPQLGSRGKGVQPRTLELFDDLGIGAQVIAHGRMAMPMVSTAPDGQVTSGGAIPESLQNRPDIPYAASLITPEWRVEEALRTKLAELGGAVEFGTTLASFVQANGVVAATMTRGGASETVRARWLVGCDGGHSIVRKQAGIAFEGVTRDEVRMIVADVRVDGLDRDAWHMWRHAEGLVALCPLPSTDLFQYGAAIAPGPGPDTELTRVNMQAILERRTGRRDIRLHEPVWSSLWRANIRLADRYRNGSVFLAGDAAHIHSPAGGQGMNTGIQDACNLGWKLAAVANGASPALLHSYEAERRPVAADVLALSNTLLARTIEQKTIPARDTSTIQLGVTYRGSVLARDDRDDAAPLRAGDRAPDATKLMTARGERRLFDLTRGGRFTLLAFGAAPAVDAAGFDVAVLRVVDQPRADGEVADAERHLARAYAATAESLVVIRPDGYVALISDAGDAAAVSAYFAALGGAKGEGSHVPGRSS